MIRDAGRIVIEKEENYHKQTWRNRCRILTPGGTMNLSVPVMKNNPKTLIKDIVIDYSKRWQQVHLGALSSSYGRSPFFLFYFDGFEKIIKKKQKYLLDLNSELLLECMNILKADRIITFSDTFLAEGENENDFRYALSPKKSSSYSCKPYTQVFTNSGFVPGLSILDLIFNTGPDAGNYL